LAGALLFDEKIRQRAALFWFGLRDVGLFYSRAVVQRTIFYFPAFLEYGSAESEQAGGLETFLSEAAQNSQLKLKNQKPTAVDVFFKAYPMIPLSCRSNQAGRTFYVQFL
jgi:hypothetical protein